MRINSQNEKKRRSELEIVWVSLCVCLRYLSQEKKWIRTVSIYTSTSTLYETKLRVGLTILVSLFSDVCLFFRTKKRKIK